MLTWNAGGRSELEVGFFAGRQAHAVREAAGEWSRSAISADGSRVALNVTGATQPPGAWQYEFASQRYTQIAPVATPGVDLSALVRPELAQVQGAGRLELSGWLYLPKASSNRVRSC